MDLSDFDHHLRRAREALDRAEQATDAQVREAHIALARAHGHRAKLARPHAEEDAE